MNEGRVIDLLAGAVAAVEGADVPRDLREAAFTGALRLLAGEQQPAEPRPEASAPLSTAIQTSPGSDDAERDSAALDMVAAGLELEPSKVVKLFAEKDDAPELILKARNLPSAKSDAAQDIALLVMAARQLGGVEEYTEAKVLRAVCRRYGKFDSANFATHMKSLDNLVIADGKGASTKRKLTQPGIEQAAELAEKYLGGD